MVFLAQGLLWYLVIAGGGIAGYPLARRLFSQPTVAWAVARLLGFALPAFLAWYAALAGLSRWAWVALPLVLLGFFVGVGSVKQASKAILPVELVGLGTFWLLACLRSPNFAVTGTEKPMDLAILASLMRPQALPPEDPWFAGYPLPYYYWGFVPWVLPAKIAGFFPDEVFNLLVPTLAACVAQLAYAWGRGAGLGPAPSAAAAAATVFAGTAQGWAEVLSASASFFHTNLWEASRGIAHTITEFPLFTFHLGDLHPHLLCQPWVLAALVAWEFASPASRLVRTLLRAFFFGIATASNPWAGPLLGLALFCFSFREKASPLPQLAQTVLAAIVAFFAFFPAWAHLPAAASGLGWVSTPTTLGEIGRVLSPALLPLAGVALFYCRSKHKLLWPAAWVFAFALLSVVSGRPLLALAVTTALPLALWAREESSLRPAATLVAAAAVALTTMELVYVKDPYGPEWYRMNTVFKTLSFVFLLLPVPTWRLLAALPRLGFRRVWLLGAVPWLLAAPHLATVVAAAWPLPKDFAGLGWMAPGEAAAAHLLHQQEGSEVLIEAVGDAYSDAARMSACSGVPTLLGWENHEGLWRPAEFGPAIRERRQLVEAMYACQDTPCVQELAAQAGATILVLGSVERRLYPALVEQALRGAGDIVFSQGEVTLVRVATPQP
jgi:YYY domain-containing protein